MIPINVGEIPNDERFVNIIYKNIQKLVIAILEEFLDGFEDVCGKDRKDILRDAETGDAFLEWIERDLGNQYRRVPRKEILSAIPTLYCIIASKDAFSIDGHILLNDILSVIIDQARNFMREYGFCKNVDGKYYVTTDGCDKCIVGQRITPAEDREYVASTYKQFRKQHRDGTVKPRKLKKMVETVKYLDEVLDIYECANEITAELLAPEEKFVLPENWWDPEIDMSQYNEPLHTVPGNIIIGETETA